MYLCSSDSMISVVEHPIYAYSVSSPRRHDQSSNARVGGWFTGVFGLQTITKQLSGQK